MSPPPAAVTGGSIGPHARRNYGEGKSSPPAGDFVACGLLERRRRSKTSAGKVAEQCGPPPDSASGKLQPSRDQPRSRGGGEGEDPGPSGFKIRSLFGLSCSASSASLVQVHAMSVRMERTLRFGARSAICRHSTARCLHSTGVIIDTQPDTRTDQGCSSPLYDNCNRSSHMDRSWNEKI